MQKEIEEFDIEWADLHHQSKDVATLYAINFFYIFAIDAQDDPVEFNDLKSLGEEKSKSLTLRLMTPVCTYANDMKM